MAKRPCTQTGQVFVMAPSSAALQGQVGICGGGGFWPFNTDALTGGISGLQVYAGASIGRIPDPGHVIGVRVQFPTLARGRPRRLTRAFDYTDHTHSGKRRPAGLWLPRLGTVVKHVVTAPPRHSGSGSTQFANICFSPPLIMLYGIQDCYTRWYSSDPADMTHWDNAARAEGFISFTPNYTWWLPVGLWGQSPGLNPVPGRVDTHGA